MKQSCKMLATMLMGRMPALTDATSKHLFTKVQDTAIVCLDIMADGDRASVARAVVCDVDTPTLLGYKKQSMNKKNKKQLVSLNDEPYFSFSLMPKCRLRDKGWLIEVLKRSINHESWLI